MFRVALFVIAPNWKQLMCSLAGEWINMDGTRDSHTKRSKLERERQICNITYIWYLIYSTNESFHRKGSHRLGEQTCGCLGGEGEKWDGLGAWG